MKNILFTCLLFFCLFSVSAVSQTASRQKDTASIEVVRGNSGLDPIIIHSKIVYNLVVADPQGPPGKITNTIGLSLGVRHWGIGVKSSVVSVMTDTPGEGFISSGGDIKLSLQGKIHARGKHALAVSGEFGLPTGKMGFGSQYFSLTPAFTYTYAIKRTAIFALQPQYSFHLIKDPLHPDLSLLSIRALFAKFTRTGHAFGGEIKATENFTSNTFVLLLTPFVSLSLGAGFNMLLLCDLPANAAGHKQGPSYTLGINRNF